MRLAASIDDIAVRQQDTNLSGTFNDTWYHLTDTLFSTIAIIDDAANLIERASYDAYGNARHHRMADLNDDGAVSSADQTLLNNNWGNFGIGDLNRDGTVDLTDLLLLNGNWGAAQPAGRISVGSGGTDNIIGYAGYIFNAEIHGGGLYTVRHRHYSPELGRWTTRDPIGYVDGMSLYEYVRSGPMIRRDPRGLSSCMDECVSGCPEIKVGEDWRGNTYRPIMTTDPACMHRCNILCSCPEETCTPKGRVDWGSPQTIPGRSGIGLTIQVVGEDPNCCSEFGILQFVRTTNMWGKRGDWDIDDGRVGGLSDPSPAAPYYDPPVQIRTPGGRGRYTYADEPGSYLNVFWEFKMLAMCTAGPAAGHISGMYSWSVGTGFYGVWSDPSFGPILPSALPNELPPMMEERRRCCEK